MRTVQTIEKAESPCHHIFTYLVGSEIRKSCVGLGSEWHAWAAGLFWKVAEFGFCLGDEGGQSRLV